MELENWPDHAACIDMDTNLFFPESGKRADPQAKRACTNCPSRYPCLEWGMDDDDGIYGAWRATHRAIIRRIGHACPMCGDWIGGTSPSAAVKWTDPDSFPPMFCTEACLLAAFDADGSVRMEIDWRLAKLEMVAVKEDRDRKRPTVEGQQVFDFGAVACLEPLDNRLRLPDTYSREG